MTRLRTYMYVDARRDVARLALFLHGVRRCGRAHAPIIARSSFDLHVLNTCQRRYSTAVQAEDAGTPLLASRSHAFSIRDEQDCTRVPLVATIVSLNVGSLLKCVIWWKLQMFLGLFKNTPATLGHASSVLRMRIMLVYRSYIYTYMYATPM